MKKTISTFLLLSFLFLSGTLLAIGFSVVIDSNVTYANDEEPIPPWATKP
ncbi:hypothetical protein [Ornithinibacillus sp. JPR2-1]